MVQEKLDGQRKFLEELRTALRIKEKLDERQKLERSMERPDFWTNQEEAQKTVLKLKGVRSVTEPFLSVERRLGDAKDLGELAAAEKDEATLKDVDRELDGIAGELEKLKLRALFTGPYDERSAIAFIQAGTGGLDACDWAQMVLRMVERYAKGRGFETKLVEITHEPEAGIKSATLLVEGQGAYGWLKSEEGTHRLVRISPFDAQSRRQTSFAKVEVTPELDDDVDVDVKESDLSWETFACGGPGGQHVNKTQSGVRVRHAPSGIVVACTEERSQHANRRRALKILTSKLANLAAEKRAREAHAEYQLKGNIGFGASDRVRSYTLQPFTLAKDHRTGHQTSDVDRVLDGEIADFVEAWLRWRASGGKPVADSGD